MQLTLSIVAVAFAMLSIVLLTVMLRRPTSGSDTVSGEQLRSLEDEAASLREEKSRLTCRLAVEEEKAGRLIEMEQLVGRHQQRIDALIEAKGLGEQRLATAAEARSQFEFSVAEVKTRLVSAEERLAATACQKSALEGTVAKHSATLVSKSEALADLGARLDQEIVQSDAARQEAGRLCICLATIEETLEQERKQNIDKLALLADAKQSMTQEFKVLAAEVMKSHGETFSQQNREQIGNILTPLRDKLGEFQLGLQTTQNETARERATLAEQIRCLSERSAKMTLETANLTRALKGEAQTQGAWGEMILSSILERSGLRESEEYFVQESHATDDGAMLRPDVVVNLPGHQKIVIDSKLSLVAFNEYVNASDVLERAGHLKRHLASIRSHIKTLSSKEYHSAIGSQLDYVVMFIPIEGALAAALQEDPALTANAVEANVAIATPTTLMIALRTVSNVWQVERRNRNAETIALRAGKIYDKLVGFLEDMACVGSRMQQARTAYEDAMSKMTSGRGNLVNQVAQLKQLGAKASKSIPADMLDDSQASLMPGAELTGMVPTARAPSAVRH